MESPNRFENGDIVRFMRNIIIRIDGVRRDEHGTLRYDVTILDEHDNFKPTSLPGGSHIDVQTIDRNSVLIQLPAGSLRSAGPNGGRKSLRKTKIKKIKKSRKTRRKRMIK